MRALKNILITVLVAAVTTLVVLVALHRVQISELRGRNVPRAEFAADSHVDNELFHDVGSVSGDRSSRFYNYPQEKPADVVRIGAFGDSLTWGSEVGDAADFPSLLQEEFHKAGLPHVEVLNFGNGSHGNSQAFRFWDKLAPKYGIDIVLLGPGCFCPPRDRSFLYQDSVPYYLKGRH